MIQTRKLFFLLGKTFVLIVVLNLYGPTVCSAQGNTHRGVIEYQGEKVLRLSGEWKLFWKKNYARDQTIIDNIPYAYVKPAPWVLLDSLQLPSFGFASYAMDIVSNKDYEKRAIAIPAFYGAYEAYLNGLLIAKNGTITELKENAHAQLQPNTVLTSFKKGHNTLVIVVSNFHHFKGGLTKVIQIGEANYLFWMKDLLLVVMSFMIGSLLVIGSFFLGMFLFWRRDRTILYYALFAISFACRISNTDIYVLGQIFPDISGTIIMKIEYFSLYFTSVFLALYFSENAQKDIYYPIVKGFIWITVFFILFTLILPLSISSKGMKYFTFCGLLMILYGLYVTIKALINKRQGILIMAISHFLIFIGTLWAGIMSMREISYIPFIYNGFLILSFLIMSMGLAQRFGVAYETISKLQEEAIQQKNLIEQMARTRSKWFANVAHELRTPITLINGPIKQFLSRQAEKNLSNLHYIQTAERNSIRLLDMIQDVLDITRLESSTLKLEKQPVSITKLVEETVSLFESAIAIGRIGLQLYINTDFVLSVDKKRIQTILVNLLSNAVKFTHQGQIVVTVNGMEESGVKITVADTGEGMAPEEQERIFERYYQISYNNRENTGGSGIGLALSKELAQLHDGDLTVASTLGFGSQFTLSLPIECIIRQKHVSIMHDAISTLSEKAAIKRPATSHDLREILIVDDNHDMRRYIKDLLSSDYHTIGALDGVDAWDKLEHHIPDLIISDVMMPRMDGFQLLNNLRSNPKMEHISVIILTAKAGQPDRLKALSIGVDDYLVKPFDEDELLARVKHIFKNKVQMDQWREGHNETNEPDSRQQFLQQAQQVVSSSLTTPAYGIPEFADALNISQRQLYRNLKVITGLSPLHFIQEIRLQKARFILENREAKTVTEVMNKVGFQRNDHFTKIYLERFGKLPSVYM